MKLEFTKLETSSETIKVDFGDGNGFKEYPVAEAKEYGIAIPDNISNFNEIKIKGNTGIITSPEVLKSIKLKQNYDIILSDVEAHKYTTGSDGSKALYLGRYNMQGNGVPVQLYNFLDDISFANISANIPTYQDYLKSGLYNKSFIIFNPLADGNRDILRVQIQTELIAIDLPSLDMDMSTSLITENDSYIINLLETLKSGAHIYLMHDTEPLDTGLRLIVESYNSTSTNANVGYLDIAEGEYK